MDRFIAGPLGRFAQEDIVDPLAGGASALAHAVGKLPLVGQMPGLVARGIDIAGAGEQQGYDAALARNRNTPGYAAQRAKADAMQANYGAPVKDSFTRPFNSTLAGTVGLLGGLDSSNANADAQAAADNSYASAHPILSGLGTLAGSLAFAPEAGVKSLPAKAVPSADPKIVSSFYKATKPTTAGKTGPGQLAAYNDNVASAAKSIVANTPNLNFEGDAGRLPQTRMELADAIGQTKGDLFKQYDALASQADGDGLQVSMEHSAKALDSVINSQALEIANPKAVQYAKNLQSRLLDSDGGYKALSPSVVQDVIQHFNASLKAFYRNPTYDTASVSAIDAGVAHQMRQTLDTAISGATGANYQALKKQYGALSAIEKEANKAAATQLKQTGSNASGLGKYIDIFSGGDMLHGILSLNPGLFAKGAAQSAASHLYQLYNSPDRAVTTMFKHAQVIPRAAQPVVLPPLTAGQLPRGLFGSGLYLNGHSQAAPAY